MFSRHYLPQLVRCEVTQGAGTLDVNTMCSDDGRDQVLRAVNPTDHAVSAEIRLTGFVPMNPVAQVTELSGPLDARNTAAEPEAIIPRRRGWNHDLSDGQTTYAFPPYSVTVLRFE